jgi:hypothetical protein
VQDEILKASTDPAFGPLVTVQNVNPLLEARTKAAKAQTISDWGRKHIQPQKQQGLKARSIVLNAQTPGASPWPACSSQI